MSSKSGARAKGTDGSDFSHRERVAPHYQISATNKSRLKTAIFFHALLFLFELAKLSTVILQYFNINVRKFHNIRLPEPFIWEYVWMASIVFILAELLAVRRNSPGIMKFYVGGTFVCGIVPLLFAICYHSGEMKAFVDSRFDIHAAGEKLFKVPIVLIRSVFVATAFLVHSLSLMFAMNLVNAWTPKKARRRHKHIF